jgi:hypothetical protein
MIFEFFLQYTIQIPGFSYSISAGGLNIFKIFEKGLVVNCHAALSRRVSVKPLLVSYFIVIRSREI